ncbi:hypothetical protein Q3G72_014100 [Acer saccharum]|nr:hypothetical protein Q3G72_014100 [Acer saccharum]
MCGRSRCTLRADDIPRACNRTGVPVRTINMDSYRPSYNVAPGSNLPVVRRADGSDVDGFLLHSMKWGLIPSFTKKTEKPNFYKMFNARSESISEKASFRSLLPKSRCLVAVEGFYEWKKDGSKKQPYYIHFKDGRPMVFAALYDSWENSEGEILYTFTIITTSSSSALQWLHDRMPVILGNKESTNTWLNGSSSSKFDMMLKPYEDSDLVWYPVTPAMGKPTVDGPECIKEIQLKTEGKNPISKFFLRKQIKEQESNLEEKSLFDKSVKTSPVKGLKEDPIKEMKVEQESDLEQKNSCDKSDEGSQPKRLKLEPVTADDTGTQSFVKKGDDDKAKSSAYMLSNEETAKKQTKQGDEEFVADLKSGPDRRDKLDTILVKKKGNLKDAGGKHFVYGDTPTCLRTSKLHPPICYSI